MTYESTILGDTPVVYWRLDEPSGTAVIDATANNNDGTYHGGPTLGVPSPIASAPASTAVAFDGSGDDQYAKGDTDVGGVDYPTFVLEGWFYVPAANAADPKGVIAGIFNADRSAGLWIARAAEDFPGLASVLCDWTGSGLPGGGVGINANPDTWFYCNVGFDGTTAWFFYSLTPGDGGGASWFDSAPIGSFDLTGEVAHLFVGGNDLGVGDGFSGRVSQVAFYGSAATFDENDPTFGPNGTHVLASVGAPAEPPDLTATPTVRLVTTRGLVVPHQIQRWVLPIICTEKVNTGAGDDIEQSQSVAEIRDFFLGLRRTGTPVVYQEGSQRHLVVVRDVSFPDGQVTRWGVGRNGVQGVLMVTLDSTEA